MVTSNILFLVPQIFKLVEFVLGGRGGVILIIMFNLNQMLG